MTWQIIVWNIFVWTFTGVMITLNHASLFWLILPAVFTAWHNGSEEMKKQEELAKKLEEIAETMKTRRF